jgi:flavin reductase (DIM6/NTAB) family NADH-FMN oxidoreductase RutF
MNSSSASLPREVDEFAHAGVEKAPCETIACARVAGAPASLECRVSRIVRLAGPSNWAVMGLVTGVHLRDNCLVEGRFDVTRYQPMARLGYRDYAAVREVFSMLRPGQKP